jgi:hypothetical protein
MRRLLPLLVAALAACQVDVEGAPCRIGSAGDCPAGQGCGFDERCSTRAASAGCPVCTPGAVRCEDTKIQECSADADRGGDPVCGGWVMTTQCRGGLVCGEKSGVPGCECAEVTDGVFWADPAAGQDASLVATGALEPSACRMPRLTDALAKASAFVAGNGVVRAVPSGDAAMVFEHESFPLRIPTNVTLEASTTATIRAPPSSTSTSLVELHGVLSGFVIENVAAQGIGIEARCVGSKPPEMRDVLVEGAGTLANGILVSGPCGSYIEDVFVRRANGAALVVDAAPEAMTTARGGRFAESGVGVELRGGTLEIEPGAAPTEIASNVREGLLISGGNGLRARAARVDVASNGGTGVVIEAVPATAEISLDGCTIRSNGFAAARTYGSDPPRTAGGMLVAQTSTLTAFSFTGNTVFANAGDQVGVWSEGAWSFSGGACGGASNAFGCIGTGAYALYATSRATVDATFNVWSSDPPTLIVSVPRVSYSPVCTGHAAAPAAPACPAE